MLVTVCSFLRRLGLGCYGYVGGCRGYVYLLLLQLSVHVLSVELIAQPPASPSHAAEVVRRSTLTEASEASKTSSVQPVATSPLAVEIEDTPTWTKRQLESDQNQPVVSDTFNFFSPSVNIRNLQEDKAYKGPKVPVSGRAVSLRAYQHKHSQAEKTRAQERLQQADVYLSAEDDKVFIKILKDIIRNYHYTQSAAQAALMLAQYYTPRDKNLAVQYYVYIINTHRHSRYAPQAFYRLAIILDENQYYLKSVALLDYAHKWLTRQLVQPAPSSTEVQVSAKFWLPAIKNYLKEQYSSFITWGDTTNNLKTMNYYKKQLAKLEKETASAEEMTSNEKATSDPLLDNPLPSELPPPIAPPNAKEK